MRFNVNTIAIAIIGLFIFKIAVADVVRDKVAKKERAKSSNVTYIK